MRLVSLPERPDWKEKAEAAGFTFHTMYGKPYWVENGAYAFTLEEVETALEDPATDLHAMCREAVAAIVASEELMDRCGIPWAARDVVAESWRAGEPELYGRFDFIHTGTGPAKMIEYNADTPTSLFEASTFQWHWLEDQIAAGVLADGSDQFNALFERLRDCFAEILPHGSDIHFTSLGGQDTNPEDYGTVETLAYMARAAGMGAHYTELSQIGLTEEGQFADAESRVIGTLFKLYPWEDMLRDDFAAHLRTARCRMIEPAWKALVSNKALLPILWRMFEGHPNLLPAVFADDAERGGDAVVTRALDALEAGAVRKPIFSREGASVTITQGDRILEQAGDRTYDAHPEIIQAYHEMPVFNGHRPILGIWMAGQAACGMGIREDASRITQDLSMFRPHFIEA